VRSGSGIYLGILLGISIVIQFILLSFSFIIFMKVLQLDPDAISLEWIVLTRHALLYNMMGVYPYSEKTNVRVGRCQPAATSHHSDCAIGFKPAGAWARYIDRPESLEPISVRRFSTPSTTFSVIPFQIFEDVVSL